jgi:hypothetical protein
MLASIRLAIRSGGWLTDRRARVYAGLVAGIAFLSLGVDWAMGAALHGHVDLNGKPIGTDFAGVWTAGRMVLEGRAADVFDPNLHFAFQREVLPNPKGEVYGWHYPPFFLVIASVLALLPYLPALLVWQGASFAFYLWTMKKIAPASMQSGGALMWLAVGFPAVFVTFGHGHNAFLTAGLIGLGLHYLDRKPWLAGVFTGLLAYKPQFGLVLPVVMLMSGNWRAIASAGATVLAMSAAVTLWLGPGVWTAFIAGSAFTREVILEQGVTGWYKIQSMFSAARSLGAPLSVAYAAQGVLTLSVIATLALAVRRKADRNLIMAMTCAAAILATPYSLDYDMMILACALAFAVKRTRETGVAPYEISLYALVWATPLFARTVMMTTGLPIGVTVMAAFFAFLGYHALRRETPIGDTGWSVARP